MLEFSTKAIYNGKSLKKTKTHKTIKKIYSGEQKRIMKEYLNKCQKIKLNNSKINKIQ